MAYKLVTSGVGQKMVESTTLRETRFSQQIPWDTPVGMHPDHWDGEQEALLPADYSGASFASRPTGNEYEFRADLEIQRSMDQFSSLWPSGQPVTLVLEWTIMAPKGFASSGFTDVHVDVGRWVRHATLGVNSTWSSTDQLTWKLFQFIRGVAVDWLASQIPKISLLSTCTPNGEWLTCTFSVYTYAATMTLSSSPSAFGQVYPDLTGLKESLGE